MTWAPTSWPPNLCSPVVPAEVMCQDAAAKRTDRLSLQATEVLRVGLCKGAQGSHHPHEAEVNPAEKPRSREDTLGLISGRWSRPARLPVERTASPAPTHGDLASGPERQLPGEEKVPQRQRGPGLTWLLSSGSR